MNVYYVAGIPYSDELYHHGIKGQKWGVRRYQNSDGSLTSFGRIRYGVGKAASGVGHAGSSVAKKIGSFIKKKYKKMRPSAMTDAEMAAATKRIKMETEYKKAVNELNSQKLSRKFGSAVTEIVRKSASTLAEEAAKAAAKKLVERAMMTKAEKIKQKTDVLNRSIEYREAVAGNVKNKREFENRMLEEKIQNRKDRDERSRLKSQEREDAKIEKLQRERREADRYIREIQTNVELKEATKKRKENQRLYQEEVDFVNKRMNRTIDKIRDWGL